MSALYDHGRGSFLDGGINFTSDTIKAILVDTALYTADLGVHDNLDDIPVGARVGSAVTLASKTSTAGVADAADLTFNAVTGATIEAIVIYQSTGVESTSKLIAYIDTATGLPATPNGGPISVVWDNGTNRIFKL